MILQQISTGSSKGNCYKYKNLMIDIGVPYTRLVNKSQGINHLEDVKIIFVSHIHGDHFYNKGGKFVAERIKKEYPKIMWVSGSNDVIEVFETLELKHTKLSLDKIYNFGIMRLQLVKLYHDVENYGIRVFDDKKGIYITDTETVEGITFKDYDWIIIEYNHDVKIHQMLANEDERFPQRYLNAFNSHLNFEQAEQAIKENAKTGTEIMLVHLSSDPIYESLGLILHYKYTKESINE